MSDPLRFGRKDLPIPPDLEPYDRALESVSFSRALFSEKELRTFDESGVPAIAAVRQYIKDNIPLHLDVSFNLIDAALLSEIDARIDYKLFIVRNEAYTREDLYKQHAFHDFHTTPEATFDRQIICVCHGGAQIVHCEADAQLPEHTEKTVRTKIFFGGEGWEDFITLERSMRAVVRASKGTPSILLHSLLALTQ